ncbi:MAG: hypothetical protein JWQ79_4153 [Mucilaginibacter sp.]|nr:hypothetical protein [Mucilaginibacter sp.]
MTSLQTLTGTPIVTVALAGNGQAKAIYDQLMQAHSEPEADTVVSFLNVQLSLAESAECPLPNVPDELAEWIGQGVSRVAQQYAAYLEARHAGAPRRFFSGKSHAMYFLQRVAPTKLVDGAWLYGLLPHWPDYRFHGLIRTYLEELGEGDPALNHVSIYQKLLADMDCALSDSLADDLYLQGAIQLALGHHGAQFLPEVIGYNLGYEQLPLHLLITSFELNELGIDPYYFTLHVTIDNASTGHARKAAQSVIALMPVGPGRDEFYRRVVNGYNLNELGVGSTAVIASFDLEQEVVAMLERKRTFGQHMHSDYCRLEGKTVNEWLAAPDQIPAFLSVLQSKGWIKRDEDPANSRFWQMIEGAGAPMFGVFNGYEKQLLSDWIAGAWVPEANVGTSKNATSPAFRSRFRKSTLDKSAGAHGIADEGDPDLQGLVKVLEECAAGERMSMLMEFMSPARHSTPAGLYATRQFAKTMTGRMKGLQA